MDRTYLQEAFREMELLESEEFGLDDAGIKDILDFQDHDELEDIVDVVDPEAETEEEVKDSYIGNVILECEVCHSPIFKSVEDVFIEEDSDVANIDEECPICHSNDGFKIIGTVAPFEEEPELKVEIEDKDCEDGECEDTDEEVEDDIDDEIEESCNKNESLTEELDADLENKIAKENLKQAKIATKMMQLDLAAKKAEMEEAPVEEVADEVEDTIEDTVEDEIEDIVEECPECEESEEVVEEELKEDLDPELEDKLEKIEDTVEEVAETVEEVADEVCTDSEATEVECEDGECEDTEGEVEESLNEARKATLYDQITKELYSAATGEKGGVDGRGHKVEGTDAERYNNDQVVANDNGVRVVAKTPEELEFAKKVASHFGAPISDVQELSANNELKAGKYYVDITVNESLDEAAKEEIREGFEKIDLEMDDKIIHVSEEEKPEVPDAEMIVPVSDELEAELTTPVEDEEETIEEPMIDEPMIEEPAEDIDYDIDEFDETDFDDLGESYLKKVYENVEAFNTTSVKLEEDKLIVEGMIKFVSGKEKATQFIFEAQDATKEGKVRFIGENCQISRGKKAFTLAGKMEGTKFIAESLNYNYRTNSNRIYGTVKTKK